MHLMVQRTDRRVFLIAALTFLIAPALADCEGSDPRLQSNPALARLQARDPAAADRILAEIDRVLASTNGVGELPERARGWKSPPEVEDPKYRELLDENPLLEEAYRINPKAVLAQLKEIVSLGGGQ
jgi:hypothetical protein